MKQIRRRTRNLCKSTCQKHRNIKTSPEGKGSPRGEGRHARNFQDARSAHETHANYLCNG